MTGAAKARTCVSRDPNDRNYREVVGDAKGVVLADVVFDQGQGP